MKLYRAEGRGTTPYPDWIPKNEAWGRWWTNALPEAESYLADFVGKENGNIVVLDIPEEEAMKYRIDHLPKEHPARWFSKKHTVEFFLPKDMLKAKTIYLGGGNK